MPSIVIRTSIRRSCSRGIEAALVSAAKRHYGEEEDIQISIDRKSGEISGTHNGEPLDSEEAVGRIGAQTAKQVMVQKIREAERDALYDEYTELEGQMVSGIIQRYEGGAATVALSQRRGHPPPAANRYPEKRTTSTNACGQPCSRSESRAAA